MDFALAFFPAARPVPDAELASPGIGEAPSPAGFSDLLDDLLALPCAMPAGAPETEELAVMASGTVQEETGVPALPDAMPLPCVGANPTSLLLTPGAAAEPPSAPIAGENPGQALRYFHPLRADHNRASGIDLRGPGPVKQNGEPAIDQAVAETGQAVAFPQTLPQRATIVRVANEPDPVLPTFATSSPSANAAPAVLSATAPAAGDDAAAPSVAAAARSPMLTDVSLAEPAPALAAASLGASAHTRPDAAAAIPAAPRPDGFAVIEDMSRLAARLALQVESGRQGAAVVIDHGDFGTLDIAFDHSRGALEALVQARDADAQKALAAAVAVERPATLRPDALSQPASSGGPLASADQRHGEGGPSHHRRDGPHGSAAGSNHRGAPDKDGGPHNRPPAHGGTLYA